MQANLHKQNERFAAAMNRCNRGTLIDCAQGGPRVFYNQVHTLVYGYFGVTTFSTMPYAWWRPFHDVRNVAYHINDMAKHSWLFSGVVSLL